MHAPVPFAAPVDPAFVTAWRDYEERYEFISSGTSGCPVYHFQKSIWDEPLPSKAELKWDNADAEASDQADGIEHAITFAQEQIDQDDRWQQSQDVWVNV